MTVPPVVPSPELTEERAWNIRDGILYLGDQKHGEATACERDLLAALDRERAENQRLREALLALFLDPLQSHGGRALARATLGIPFIPFASPAEMIAAASSSSPGGQT